MESQVVCPVCTLFLRPGITLKEHLASHPKVKVIEALVKLSSESTALEKSSHTTNQSNALPQSSGTNQSALPSCANTYPTSVPFMGSQMQDMQNQNWQQPNIVQNAQNFQQPMALNQSIIYQQIMTNTPITPGSSQTVMNNLSQQYMTIPVPGMFDSQINSPLNYMYQQQQLIMNCNLPSIVPVMSQMNIGVPVNSQFNQTKSIEGSAGTTIICSTSNAQATKDPLAIKPTSSSTALQIPSTDVRKSAVQPRNVNLSKFPVRIAPAPAERRVSIIKPTKSANQNNNIVSFQQKTHSEMVLIRDNSFVTKDSCRAIIVPSSSGVVIEEIDPLSMTPSPSPVLNQQTRLSSDMSVPMPMPMIELDEKKEEEEAEEQKSEEINVVNSLQDYDEVKSPLSEVLATINNETAPEEETITPDIQCPQDLRTFCKTPINETSIRPPVIASPPRRSVQISADLADGFMPMDKSLSDPPYDPLTENVVISAVSQIGRKHSPNDDVPSPSSSVGSDFSLRVRKDLQPSVQPYEEISQNIELKTSTVPSSLEISEMIANETPRISTPPEQTRQSSIVICSTRGLSQDSGLPSSNIETQKSTNSLFKESQQASSSGTSSSDAMKISLDSALMDDVDSDPLILTNDFITSHTLISRVNDFEVINPTQGRVLMNIGGMHHDPITEESSRMNEPDVASLPPRSEMSEESNGTCDISWSRIQYQEGSSGLSTTYDLFARESWEPSDLSDSEHTFPPPSIQKSGAINSTQSSAELESSETHLIAETQPPPAPLNYRCSACGQRFGCPKERRRHQARDHKKPKVPKQPKTPKPPKTPKEKQPKKKITVPKPKTVPAPVKTETKFDNLFSSELKIKGELTKTEIESTDTIVQDVLIPHPLIDTKDVKFTKTEFRYNCAACEEKFVTESAYNQHLKLHPLECRICGKYFYRRINLKLHLKRHMGYKPHKCETCGKAFITKQKLEEHINTHTGAAPIKCNMCDETFRRHSNLVQHRNRHHLNIKKKVKDYVCQCGEIFHSKKKLHWHQETHDMKPKACTYCREKFIHMSSLTRHMRRAHNQYYVPQKERETENVECPVCKNVYLKSSIESHIRTHSGQKLHQCTICNKEFTTKWNLKLHKWTHASRTSKPYKCELCNGAFIRQTDYIAHMNSHKSVKPYTCNYCGMQFIRKYNCQRHVKEHEEGKSYTCSVCNKTFHRSYYLKEHMRVHTGARPYSCHICGKTSTTKSNHNKHVRIHHAREPVSTEG